MPILRHLSCFFFRPVTVSYFPFSFCNQFPSPFGRYQLWTGRSSYMLFPKTYFGATLHVYNPNYRKVSTSALSLSLSTINCYGSDQRISYITQNSSIRRYPLFIVVPIKFFAFYWTITDDPLTIPGLSRFTSIEYRFPLAFAILSPLLRPVTP